MPGDGELVQQNHWKRRYLDHPWVRHNYKQIYVHRLKSSLKDAGIRPEVVSEVSFKDVTMQDTPSFKDVDCSEPARLPPSLGRILCADLLSMMKSQRYLILEYIL